MPIVPRLPGCALALALLSGCGAGGDPRLLIVTTDDVAGKTSPCGCHTPKGGLARRAAFLDSVRAEHRAVLVLDAGGFFPATDAEREAGPFMMRAMARLGTRAAGVGANELRSGYAFVREQARAARLPLVCTNLVEFASGRPAFEPWRVFHVGGLDVGVFGLIAESTDLGPARDSLRIEPAEDAARRAVSTLRRQGADVVVLLSQLGMTMGDSVANHVPGIDLVVGGGGVPALPSGVPVGGAVALHGGTQGWQVGVANVFPGRVGRPARIEARTVILGPDVKTQPAMAASVKAFEDSLDAHLRLRNAAEAGAAARRIRPGGSGPHYLGMSRCISCHPSEYAQWRTTAHARAWRTLVDQHKSSTPACVSCHVTGFGEPGGFRVADDIRGDAARLGDVQCEACHGMGSGHEDWIGTGRKVLESTCRACHTDITSPTFSLAQYRPHVVHNPPPGLTPLPEAPAHKLMQAGKRLHP